MGEHDRKTGEQAEHGEGEQPDQPGEKDGARRHGGLQAELSGGSLRILHLGSQPILIFMPAEVQLSWCWIGLGSRLIIGWLGRTRRRTGMDGVLEGIRVLEFGRYIAGPYCAALMAEHGAEVIRIEKREGSEDRFQAPVAATGEGALFLQMNRNKRGMTLDPMRPEGQEVVRRLVETADVVVANLPPQTLAAMRLDHESLKAIKPDIILTTVTAYGRGGPYADRVGFDGVGQVMSGAVYMTGEAQQPYRAQVPWVDFSTALHCAFGTMVALLSRQATGTGQVVEGALLGTAVTLSNALLIEQALIKPDRVPT